jgi:hypothetical protein
MPRSTYARDNELNWMRGTNYPAAPVTVYAALWDGDPGLDGSGGTEVTDQIEASGQRIAVPWSAIAGNVISNTAQVDYGESDGAVANVDHFALYDDPDPGEGNIIGSAPLAAAKAINIGDPVYFDTGDLTYTAT